MPAWCDTEDVDKRLRFAQGRNFNADDYQAAMEEARDRMVSDLLGKISQTVIDTWDDAIANVPPQIRRSASRLAAAYLLRDFYDGEVITDRNTKAGGFYAEYKDELKSLLDGESVLTTSESDNTKVSRSDKLLKSSTSHRDPVFTKGTQADGSDGSMDGFGV